MWHVSIGINWCWWVKSHSCLLITWQVCGRCCIEWPSYKTIVAICLCWSAQYWSPKGDTRLWALRGQYICQCMVTANCHQWMQTLMLPFHHWLTVHFIHRCHLRMCVQLMRKNRHLEESKLIALKQYNLLLVFCLKKCKSYSKATFPLTRAPHYFGQVISQRPLVLWSWNFLQLLSKVSEASKTF